MHGTTCWPWASSRLGYSYTMTSRWRQRTELPVHCGVEMAACGSKYLTGTSGGWTWCVLRSTAVDQCRGLTHLDGDVARVRCASASSSCKLGRAVLLAITTGQSVNSTYMMYMHRRSLAIYLPATLLHQLAVTFHRLFVMYRVAHNWQPSPKPHRHHTLWKSCGVGVVWAKVVSKLWATSYACNMTISQSVCRVPGVMAPNEPWLTQLWTLWRQHRLVLTQVLRRLNHFYEQLSNNMTNFALLLTD